MFIKKIIEQHWEKPKLYLKFILYPLSIIFLILVSIRLFLYKIKILPSKKLTVPVIVVGNIHVGGTGKTPIIIYIANCLKEKGIKVGIISRGYARCSKETLIIDNDKDVYAYGDEPLLISYKTKVPVAVGNDKFKTANLLIQKYKDIQIILSDDGLQHYKLFKDYEIVVFPSKEINKKMFMLPQGKLREPLAKLQKSNAIIFTTDILNNKLDLNQFQFNKNISLHTAYLIYDNIYSLDNINKKTNIDYFNNKKNIAICAIGNPNNFFNLLIRLGIKLENTLAFIDHHTFCKNDIPTHFDNIIITEKDAIKIKKLNLNNVWVLSIKVNINPDIIGKIIKII